MSLLGNKHVPGPLLNDRCSTAHVDHEGAVVVIDGGGALHILLYCLREVLLEDLLRTISLRYHRI
jgi:hypothetical protein